MNVFFFTRVSWLIVALTAVLALSMSAPAMAQDTVEANLLGSCATTYDPAVDYFPDEVAIEYAETFEVEYHENYKVIRVLTPWQGAEQTFEYVLVQCGTPAPEGYDDALMVEVPVGRVISLSTTYLPHFVELNQLDSLVAVDETDFIYDADIRARIDAGELPEVGSGSSINIEQVIDIDPDLILAFGFGSDFDAHPVLLQAGLPVALNADYVETTPLGRAEWLKFTAMFFNREAEANALFGQIADDYQALTALTADAVDRPTVMVNGMFQGTWYISGGASYAAQLIEDAGGDYLWAEDESVGGVPLSFEAVLERAQNADFWLNANFWLSLDEGMAEDERYAEFAPFQNQSVYNNNARVTNLGGNDYTESGVLRPDLVLADLIAIFHPELLLDHELYYFRHLE